MPHTFPATRPLLAPDAPAIAGTDGVSSMAGSSMETLDRLQPHGWLLLVDVTEGRLVRAGANLPALLGRKLPDLLGLPLRDILGRAAARTIRRALDQAGPDAIGPLSLRLHTPTGPQRLVLQGHVTAAGLVLELEPADGGRAGGLIVAGFGAAIRRYRHLGSLSDLAQAVTGDMRDLSGFERAFMVHVDVEDGEPRVIAAAGAAELTIAAPGNTRVPPLERALLELNRVRLFQDVQAEPVTLYPVDGEAIDLSRSTLRQPTQLFTDHAGARGARSVMLVSLLTSGRLWGYLWCESRTRRTVSPTLRALCEGLGEVVAAQISTLEERSLLAMRTRASMALARLGRYLRQGPDLFDGLMARCSDLTDLVPHDALYLALGNASWSSTGGPAPVIDHDLQRQGDGIACADGGPGPALMRIHLPDGHVTLTRQVPRRWSAAEMEVAQELYHLLAERYAEIYRHQTEQQLHRLAHFDAITGLPNRAHLLRSLDQALVTARDVAVTVIGLDRFRAMKAALGEADIDAMLAALAKRLSDCVQPGDLLGRTDTGEFAVLSLTDGTTRADILGHAVRDALRAPLSIAGREMFVTASLGIATYHEGTGNAASLLRDAEIASAEVENAGGGGRRVFDDAMRSRLTERHAIYDRLRQAIYFTHGVRPVFQPIVRLDDNRLTGFEALARWTDGERGPVSPASFVAVAEETGLIVPLGNHILVQSCRQVVRWNRDRPDDPLYVSVNLSPYQLDPSRLDIVRWVTGVLEMTGCQPSWLKLEITESGLIGQGSDALSILTALRDLGIRLAIDDFGTGYSSLAYLQNLPVDTIKIDRSFIAAMNDDRGVALVSAILHIAGIMEYGVVAEGVETAEQAAQLRQMGCDRAQGYHFARPLEADQALAMAHSGPLVPAIMLEQASARAHQRL